VYVWIMNIWIIIWNTCTRSISYKYVSETEEKYSYSLGFSISPISRCSFICVCVNDRRTTLL
jgi:ABC-type Fe3+-siderophore transport system permease subunit